MKNYLFVGLAALAVLTVSYGQISIPPIPTTLLNSLATALAKPVLQVDLFLAKILNSGIIDPKILGYLNYGYNQLGAAQCKGLDGSTGLNIFDFVYQIIDGRNPSSVTDFGGDYACPANCPNGKCTPYQNLTDGPPTLYPWACECSQGGCDANGPIMPYPVLLPAVTIECNPYEACTCNGMDPNATYTGYICNWWNVLLDQPVQILVGYPAQLSPIRWCTCCPN